MEDHSTHEQLLRELTELRLRVQELETLRNRLTQVEEDLQHAQHTYDKRIRELNFFYAISRLVDRPDITFEEILQGTINLIPPAWQYPEITCARVAVENYRFTTPHFTETPWKQAAEIIVEGQCCGTLEVYYREERPACDEGPFLKEERKLINVIAERLGKIIDRKQAAEILLKNEEKFQSHFANISDVIYAISPEYTILSVSPSIERILGYSPDELIGRSFMELNLLAEQSLEKAISDTNRVLGGERIDSSVYEFIAKDGTKIFGEVSGAPHYKDGKVVAVISVARDVSDRMRAEEELRKTKDYLDNVVESSLDCIVVSDIKGYITRVNKALLQLLGYDEEALIGKIATVLAPPEKGIYESITGDLITITEAFFQEAHTTLNTLQTEGKISYWETYLINKEGIVIPVEENIVYLHDREGNRIGAVGIIRDSTERKKNEEERIGIETRLQDKVTELSIMNEISEVLLSIRELNEILHMILIGATAYQALGFNRAFLFLITEDETMLEGKMAIGSLNPDEAYRIWARLADEHHTLKELLKSRQGELSQEDIPINNLVKQMKLPLQEKESIFTQAIHEKKSFNIINGTHHPLIEKDFIRLLGTDTFALVPLTARGKSLGLLLADNFINRKPISDEDVARLGAFANHASLAIENSHLYQSLEEKIAELSSAYQELRENRDKLLRYERLSAVGNVAARITHEIRNPLVAIGGFARRILKRDQEGEVNRNYLRIIVEEISRLENTLASILAFTKPAEPQCSATDVNTIVKTTLEVMGIELEKNNISVEEYYDVHLPLLWLDENQIRQVMINLFRNAIQAMPDGGTVTVATIAEHLWVKVEIADTGVGITDEDMDRLFDAFFTSKSTGSGLGLTVSAQIINHHGGTIEVRKREPRGTTFTVKLPVTPPPEKAIT